MNKIKSVGFLFMVACLMGCDSGSLSRNELERLSEIEIGNGLTIHPDRNLILISKPSDEKDPVTGRVLYRIYELEWQGDRWSDPMLVSFNSSHTDYHPVFSPDGEWVYFNSNRPLPDSSSKVDKMNIWRVRLNDESWESPEYLTEINTEHHESYPTLAADGTLYFNSDRPGGKGSMDIYRADFSGQNFERPVAVAELNTSDSENDLTVYPLGNFLILNRYHFDSKEISLYISYWEGGNWTLPTPMKKVNESGIWELTPTISPDGDYLFYEVEGKIRMFNLSQP